MTTKQKNAALAKDIYDWCMENDMWFDVFIYFNGKAWAPIKKWGTVEGKRIGEQLYEYAGKDPSIYFDYANPFTVSMTFEGDLNSVLNGVSRYDYKLEQQFENLFKKYGYYYELGNEWNLAAYEI